MSNGIDMPHALESRMRENRPYGSVGGAAMFVVVPTLSWEMHFQPVR